MNKTVVIRGRVTLNSRGGMGSDPTVRSLQVILALGQIALYL